MVLFPAVRGSDAPESSPVLVDRVWAAPSVASSAAAEIEISPVLRALLTPRKTLDASALIGLSFSLRLVKCAKNCFDFMSSPLRLFAATSRRG
jgi:hypothetical protein